MSNYTAFIPDYKLIQQIFDYDAFNFDFGSESKCVKYNFNFT